MGEAVVLSAELYRYWHLDFQRRRVKIVCQDGQILEEALPSEFSPKNSQIASSTFDWEKWWIISTTTRGHRIITEGFNPDSPPPLNGRSTVYLDQNRWRTVADALHDPERVADVGERRAALELIQLALDGGIVLPLSMGHMLETAGLHNERRYEVGLAMASLAGGWQIRNPLDLWKQEAELTIRDHLGLPIVGRIYPIVTEPGALFGSDTKLGIAKEATDTAILMAMLTMPNVILGSLIDPEPMPKHPLTMWIDHHTRITSRMDAENLPKKRRRQLAQRRYWNENIGFYTPPYRKLTCSPDFPTFSDRELTNLLSISPMVGLLSELFVRRFTDRQNKWRRNDLIDIFHLSSAAGYADYVCAENHTGTQLREAQRALGRNETVFTSLDALVAALRRDGAKTQSERLLDSESGHHG
ncbi:hypothetical protein NNX28_05425 [Arthrobacter sp. zg-Y859]|uniref:Uncharacterized protein n=1 Tax=Arthrobacter jinronghuae TaxID=2964609 RepID=A0ABT1NNQ9_9MICC|nr:hypothetical protein [Arthrobacter jinronghuae]MCQ1949370.1 hypothetical protein [Arthrobacter jinronghuae]UWX77854.1 hypothetical protein N2K98_12835 [Arthrobacter jinronghuae]